MKEGVGENPWGVRVKVGVGLATNPGVKVGVGVGLGVGGRVATVGSGVIGGASAPTSTDPTSHALPYGRGAPRWSAITLTLLRSAQSVTASIAALPVSRAWVCVGPPLLPSGPRFSAAEVTTVNPPQLGSVARFTPLGFIVPEQFGPPPPAVLSPTIEFFTLTVPLSWNIPPPLPEAPALLAAMVTKLAFTVPP